MVLCQVVEVSFIICYGLRIKLFMKAPEQIPVKVLAFLNLLCGLTPLKTQCTKRRYEMSVGGVTEIWEPSYMFLTIATAASKDDVDVNCVNFTAPVQECHDKILLTEIQCAEQDPVM